MWLKALFASQNENQDHTVQFELHRPEGVNRIYTELPDNVSVSRHYFSSLDIEIFGHGTLIPCLAALDACDVVIAVGGKLTVRLIGRIAADKDKSLLAIPSFGGSSAELYDRLKYLYKSVFKDHRETFSAITSPWDDLSGERMIELAELLGQRHVQQSPHSYFISYNWEECTIADHIEVLLQRKRRSVHRDESMFSAGSIYRTS